MQGYTLEKDTKHDPSTIISLVEIFPVIPVLFYFCQVERSVGLSGRGSVALRPVALGREADITLTFTTLQEDAVILAAGDLRDRNKRDVNFDAVDVSVKDHLMFLSQLQ